jgi:hypothetical protein
LRLDPHPAGAPKSSETERALATRKQSGKISPKWHTGSLHELLAEKKHQLSNRNAWQNSLKMFSILGCSSLTLNPNASLAT